MSLQKILIVEDDNRIQRLISMTLSEFKNEQVIISNGLKAIEYIKENHEQLGIIFLDVGLEGVNGFEVLRTIRKDFGLQTPVVVVSAYVSKSDIETGVELGADHYLVKPFNLRKLLEVCNNYLRSE
ncbi:response regulator transcription factor [Candidatus Calescamantes bacterium]|nr:response regulator transcription factor [Candidatus Calescamantes bacterium]MCK5598630.1 response regulator transcription factor [bacterium]